jgi:hypothetical protein
MMKAEEVKKQVMNHYSDLRNKGSIEQKYPELDMEDGKKHVLFVQCLLERNGFYRTYLPYLMLNDSDTHTAIIASIQKRDFNKSFENYDVFLQVDLIRWADVIVFPSLFFDCKKMFSSILSVNPNIRFIMDLDEMHSVEVKSENGNDLQEKVEPTLLKNIRFTHAIACSSSKLVELYKQEFNEIQEGNKKQFISLPTFLVSSFVEQRSDDPTEHSSIVKIGLQFGNFDQSTLDSISKVATETEQTVKIFIYGNSKEDFNYPTNLTIEKVTEVKFLDYFIALQNMDLDFIIRKGNNENTESKKAIFNYGEPALLSIPLLCDESYQGRRFVKANTNGFVISNEEPLEAYLTTIFKDITIAHKAGKAAQGMALKHLSWNAERAKQLINIFQ